MSFANLQNGVGSQRIDKAKIIFDKELRGANNERLRELLLGERRSGNETSTNDIAIMEPLLEDGGIVFDYTPNIAIQHSTSYASMEIVHNNYDFNAYSKSNINDITLNFPVTSETIQKADKTLAIIHFLRTFSKMNFGINDPLKGLPPRILRFYAYGDYMVNNVPVAIRSFTVPLPENVDYVQTSYNTQVPIVMNFQLTLTMMPTPSKVKREFNLQDFTSGKTLKKGYL